MSQYQIIAEVTRTEDGWTHNRSVPTFTVGNAISHAEACKKARRVIDPFGDIEKLGEIHVTATPIED